MYYVCITFCLREKTKNENVLLSVSIFAFTIAIRSTVYRSTNAVVRVKYLGTRGIHRAWKVRTVLMWTPIHINAVFYIGNFFGC
jgi:hypothetical protein